MLIDREIQETIRVGMSDLATGEIAPTELWYATILALGPQQARHSVGRRTYGDGTTTWDILVLADHTVVTVTGEANFVGWDAGSGQPAPHDQFEITSRVRPYSDFTHYSVDQIRVTDRASRAEKAVGRYTFGTSTPDDIIELNAAKQSGTVPLEVTEAAAQFFIERAFMR